MIKNIYIPAEEQTPEILLDADKGIFYIKGISRPENVLDVYNPVLNWLQEYAACQPEAINFTISYTSINTASMKMLMLVLNKLKEIENQSTVVRIAWEYDTDDDGVLELGELVEKMSGLNFKYIRL